ncbi:MAG: UDP-glucose 4-epimerase GalE, partial [Candidatus Aminicenantes bacterium]|nr:UDP-glucose 4-epimerase GalE [Candidatus Aminicenantes bacterium]
MTTIFVAGGAGYIGSHTVKALLDGGARVIVFDDLSSGRAEFVRRAELIVGDLMDREAVAAALRGRAVDAVLHFASLIQVGESYADPRKYYSRNIGTSLHLLGAMLDAGVRNFVFSSSAAVYGVPREIPLPESHPLEPFNPYGQTKAVVERILADYGRAYGLRYISLRYFNAAGADPGGEMGEVHDPESHLIPNILFALLGRKECLDVFGTDFPTPDGTAVRDYIHVSDLAAAHVLALEKLLAGHPS